MSQRTSLYLLIRWLALVAVADWLINRSLTRFAIFMPKSGIVLTLYQALTEVGQFAFTLTGLLAVVTLSWLAWEGRQRQRGLWSLIILALLASSLIYVVIPPRDWMPVSYHLLMLAAIVLLAVRLPLVLILPGVALFVGELYQLGAAVGNALVLPGPIPWSSTLFNVGEMLVVASAYALWFVYGRGRTGYLTWLLAAILALSFAIFYFFQPAMAGIMVIWSIGLTLYLPWPLYALSMWLAGATFGVSLRRYNGVSWAILLLLAGGYAPQVSTYAFLGLVALWLLSAEPVPSVELVTAARDAINSKRLPLAFLCDLVRNAGA